MSRADLAEAVCAWLWRERGIQTPLDGHYIAKLERGAVRRTGNLYREALRAVLGVATDRELGMDRPDPPNPADRAPEDTTNDLSSPIRTICDTCPGLPAAEVLRALQTLTKQGVSAPKLNGLTLQPINLRQQNLDPLTTARRCRRLEHLPAPPLPKPTVT
jgi:hypothetical protein